MSHSDTPVPCPPPPPRGGRPRSRAWLCAFAGLAAAAALTGCGEGGSGSGGGEGGDGSTGGSNCAPVEERSVFMTWGGTQPKVASPERDGTYVYWTEEDNDDYNYPLYRAKWGESKAELVTEVHHTWLIDDGYAYSSEVNLVERTPLAGGDAEPVYEFEESALGEIAIHDGRLYWFADSLEGTYRLRSMPKEGGAVKVLAEETVAVYTQLWAMHVDASGVYATIQQGNVYTRFLRFPLEGGEPVEIYAYSDAVDDPIHLSWSTKIVSTDEHVYVCGNAVVRYTKADGSLTKLSDDDCWDIAVSDDAAYWIHGESTLDERGTPPATIERAGHSDAASEPVIQEKSAAWAVLVDECNLFWATTDGIRARRR
jgi:hypothetical protein